MRRPGSWCLWFLLSVATLLTACERPAEKVHHEQIFAFGTLVEITIAGTDEATAQRGSTAVIRTLNELHRRWHAWEPSPLTTLNEQLARGAATDVEADMLPVILAAQQLSRASDGLFNPALGRLLSHWGFQLEQRPEEVPPPHPDAVRELLAQHPSMEDLHVENGQLRSANPAVQLDFGAYLKGYGVDLAIEALQQLGIAHAIVNAGGDLRAIGRRGERPWRVGIRDPRGPGVLASLQIEGDECVFTSGDYERYFDHEGVRYHHILDPRTGYPARGTTSVTVVHGSGAAADAAATALFIAGPERWRETARAMGIEHVMLVDAAGKVWATPGLAARLTFESAQPPEMEVVTLP